MTRKRKWSKYARFKISLKIVIILFEIQIHEGALKHQRFCEAASLLHSGTRSAEWLQKEFGWKESILERAVKRYEKTGSYVCISTAAAEKLAKRQAIALQSLTREGEKMSKESSRPANLEMDTISAQQGDWPRQDILCIGSCAGCVERKPIKAKKAQVSWTTCPHCFTIGSCPVLDCMAILTRHINKCRPHAP